MLDQLTQFVVESLAADFLMRLGYVLIFSAGVCLGLLLALIHYERGQGDV